MICSWARLSLDQKETRKIIVAFPFPQHKARQKSHIHTCIGVVVLLTCCSVFKLWIFIRRELCAFLGICVYLCTDADMYMWRLSACMWFQSVYGKKTHTCTHIIVKRLKCIKSVEIFNKCCVFNSLWLTCSQQSSSNLILFKQTHIHMNFSSASTHHIYLLSSESLTFGLSPTALQTLAHSCIHSLIHAFTVQSVLY